MESLPYTEKEGFEPSFAEKAQGKRVGFQNEGTAPGEDGDEPPEHALASGADIPVQVRVAPSGAVAETGQDDPHGQARAVTGAGTPPPLMPASPADAPAEDGDEPPIDGAFTERGESSRRSPSGSDPCTDDSAVADAMPRSASVPLDAALAEKVRAITSRKSEVVE